jgi:creatinine amidohydrolase
MYLYPDKVRTSMIEEKDIVFEDFREYLYHENCGIPDGYIGCLGYPKSATAEKGKVLVEKMIDRTINEYKKALK